MKVNEDKTQDLLSKYQSQNILELRELLLKTLNQKIRVEKKIDIGIKNWKNLCNDINKGSTMIISGDIGSGKTLFALQFLWHGLQHEENGIYISFDRSKETVLQLGTSMKWDFYQYEGKGRFMFIDYPYTELDKFAQKDSVIADFIQNLNAKRLVVDSIEPIMLLGEGHLGIRKEVKRFFERLKVWGCTTLVITRMHGSELEKHEWILSMADGVINLRIDRSKKETKRLIEILKINHGEPRDETVEFTIESRKGIVLSERKR